MKRAMVQRVICLDFAKKPRKRPKAKASESRPVNEMEALLWRLQELCEESEIADQEENPDKGGA